PTSSPPNAYHLRLRPPTAALDSATAALTSWHCFNRMLGQLYHCLQDHELFDEDTAFPTSLTPQLDGLCA
ncbi:hypothetical protein ABZV67_44355, partial [Streptomyces sp. NPDC005065]